MEAKARKEQGGKLDSANQLVSFLCAGQEYAVEIGYIREILRMVSITPIPDAPEAILGVINLRGNVIPIMDLKRRLKMGPTKIELNTPIIVTYLGIKQVGLVVDAVREVIIPAEKNVQPVSDALSGLRHVKAVAKIGSTLVHCLDLEVILSDAEIATERRRPNRPWSSPEAPATTAKMPSVETA